MRIAFRVDANRTIGTGHFVRCLTLADALKQRGAEVRFVCRELLDVFDGMLAARRHELVRLPAHAEDALETAHGLSDRPVDWLVVDHYALDARWEKLLRGTAGRILAIDDLADRYHDCDVLVDPNVHANMTDRYAGKVPPHCQLLVGPRFALLRDEFRQRHEQVRVRGGRVQRLLVCFGGVDADDHTSLAIEALSRVMAVDLTVDVVIGAEHSRRGQIEAECATLGFSCHVQTDRMAELMAAADLAVGAGGGTTWERCSLGLPALAFAVADNQRLQLQGAAVEGLVDAPDVPADGMSAPFIARHLLALLENTGLRLAIARRSIAMVDARGVSRVIQHMGIGDVELRLAVADDARMLFTWRNHPSVRAVSLNGDPIEWTHHQQWLASVLAHPDRLLLIGHRADAPVGVVRFDICDDQARVSVYLVPGTSEPGLGSQLLRSAERWLSSSRPDVHEWLADVVGNNVASHRLFAAAGYAVERTSYRKTMAHA
jgi:UDP-2,4-diacetamido-2,4,6-trideoxy-beta-L-altropyranose hydrolase